MELSKNSTETIDIWNVKGHKTIESLHVHIWSSRPGSVYVSFHYKAGHTISIIAYWNNLRGTSQGYYRFLKALKYTYV